jgi:putative acid phosphatase of HAD superfamily subfamily IIIB
MRQLLAILGAAVVVALVAAGLAGALSGSVPAPPANPTSADQIQNIDQVKTAIKGYYGDTPTGQLDPVKGATTLHQFAPSGAYANEMAGIVADAEKYLNKPPGSGNGKKFSGKKAVLFDIDDTTLNTYPYEIWSNFVFNPTENAAFVNACLTTGCVFQAVPGMVGLEKYAEDHGYTVFFLTGRPNNPTTGANQLPGTLANLTAAGYDVTEANVYLKDANATTEPWLASCAPTCSTIQYKSLTRQYIESQGYDIVANFGDQFSDLEGGFADKTFKLPNPMYYLP